jgi:hypothetical protein
MARRIGDDEERIISSAAGDGWSKNSVRLASAVLDRSHSPEARGKSMSLSLPPGAGRQDGQIVDVHLAASLRNISGSSFQKPQRRGVPYY